MKKKLLNIIQKITNTNFEEISVHDYAFEIFLPLIFFSWFFWLLKYYNFFINILLNLLILTGWVIYFRRLSEENKKE